jgi:hypothetical protein
LAGVFFGIVLVFSFGLAVDVFFVVSGMGMPGIPGMPVVWAARLLPPEKIVSTAANAATYRNGICQSLIIGSPRHAWRKLAIRNV